MFEICNTKNAIFPLSKHNINIKKGAVLKICKKVVVAQNQEAWWLNGVQQSRVRIRYLPSPQLTANLLVG
jgi:hypothetical protein